MKFIHTHLLLPFINQISLHFLSHHRIRVATIKATPPNELYPESWTLKKSPMIRGFCVFLSKNLVIMEPTIEMRYGEWVKLFLTKFK